MILCFNFNKNNPNMKPFNLTTSRNKLLFIDFNCKNKILWFMLIIIFSGCVLQNNIAIEKRHYRKGYYIASLGKLMGNMYNHTNNPSEIKTFDEQSLMSNSHLNEDISLVATNTTEGLAISQLAEQADKSGDIHFVKPVLPKSAQNIQPSPSEQNNPKDKKQATKTHNMNGGIMAGLSTLLALIAMIGCCIGNYNLMLILSLLAIAFLFLSLFEEHDDGGELFLMALLINTISFTIAVIYYFSQN